MTSPTTSPRTPLRTSSPATASPDQTLTDRVPVEQRAAGLDRRSFPYALFVIAVFVVCTVVVPRIDDALEWDDPVRAGEQLALTEGGVVFEPATGWNVEEGFRLDLDTTVPPAGRAVVVDDGVRLTVVPGQFDGTPT